MKKTKKRKIRWLVKAVCLGVYFLVVCEIVLRFIDPVPMLPRYVCSMPYGIRGNEPNKSYWHRTAEYKVHIQTNSKGIRCPYEISYDKPSDVKRIVVLGDSFGMGYGVNYEQMFSTRLQFYLENRYGIKTEVVNLSTSGHGNAEELIVLENEGLKYDPDLVLLAWHATDYDDNVRSNLYGLEDGKLKRKAQVYLPGVKIRESLSKIPLYNFLAENSQLYNFFRDQAGYRMQLLLTSLRSSQIKKSQNPSREARVDIYPQELMFKLLQEIREQSKQVGAKFLILDIPRRKNRTEFISSFPTYDPGKYGNFNVFSPIDSFAVANGEKIYWERSHGHFTPLGCDRVGYGLAEYIVNNKLLMQESRFSEVD